ncbi:hypothetical protein Nepgr_009209 [Nepenthes gracilis]|uniref:Small ribosomal subunit protein bS18c n=1 Tax=Nepenthes gracilis TaxID=150966 RepID=A0AAD3SAQ4_NEPGR|nr:hypothetical protein Nepgr_009209 [Nepenthes gracilis]
MAMSWFRNLVKPSTFKRKSVAPSLPTLYSSLSLFTTESTAQFTSPADTYYAGLEPTKPNEKPRVVVLGSGWAGCRLMKDLDTKIYDVVCVSPRNHMVFTPLLASTCVGTLEFRSVAEPIGAIQPSISREPGSYFLLANCTGVDLANHEVRCETTTKGAQALDPWKFRVSYDKLVIACGAQASTFGIRGVLEHAIFLREVHHAQEIRRKLLLNLMLSEVPGMAEEEKRRLLHCVVVGGGPTGVEFSGELSDFIVKDVRRRYAHVKDYIHVTLIEANEILSSFDDRLRRYATKQLIKSGVRLVRGIVKDVQPDKIILSDGAEVPYGLLVWSTGVGPSPFVRSLELPKSPGGRIGVDEWLRVPSVPDIYAIGDCCGFLDSTGKPVLPALAQVAERQGKYLAQLLNKVGKAGGGRASSGKDIDLGDPFVYKHLGSMATIGRYKALVDLRQSKEARGLSLAGFTSWFIWRSAYLTRIPPVASATEVTASNRIYDEMKNLLHPINFKAQCFEAHSIKGSHCPSPKYENYFRRNPLSFCLPLRPPLICQCSHHFRLNLTRLREEFTQFNQGLKSSSLIRGNLYFMEKMKLIQVAFRPVSVGLSHQFWGHPMARTFSINATSGTVNNDNQNAHSFESADEFERRIFDGISGDISNPFFQKLDRLEKARGRFGPDSQLNGGNKSDVLDGLDESFSTLSDGMEGKLKKAAAYFEFNPEEIEQDDYTFRPDMNFQWGMTYEPKDLDLNKRGVWKPSKRQEFQVTTEEVLRKADFRNVRFLANFITDAGIIIKRSKTKISAKAQRKVAREIKTARAFGLLPFTTMGTKAFKFGKTMEDLDEDYEYDSHNNRMALDADVNPE